MAKQKRTDIFDSLKARLIGQLDSLVPFLALSHREIFKVLSAKYSHWYTDQRRSTLPNSFNEYSHQVANAAFLLGYSYSEAFVTELLFEVYNAHRDLLPAEKRLPFREILQVKDFEQVIRQMVEATVGDMNSLEAKLIHIEKKLSWRIPQINSFLDAHVARNALVHNAGRINRQLPRSSRWHRGETVLLLEKDVHEFGLLARGFAREVCEKAKML